jgi:hypothetical protein
MDKRNSSLFDQIDGLKPVDPKAIAAYLRAMTQEVIPEIVKVIEERRLLASESRNWQLKH